MSSAGLPIANIPNMSNGHAVNMHLAESQFTRTKNKKQHKDNNAKHYNAYIANNRQNHISPGISRNSDEYYDEIIDGSLPTNTWMTDNRNLAVNSSRNLMSERTVNHDPSFDKPTEETLKMAKGTKRGFKFYVDLFKG